MIKLEIHVSTKKSKHLEFFQTLELIRSDLLNFSTSLTVTEEDHSFFIVAGIDSPNKLATILNSPELKILSGAISVLAEKSEITIHGLGYKMKGNDLKEIRLKTEKRKS